MKDFFSKNKELLTTAMFLLAVFVVVFMLIIPLWNQAKVKVNKIQEKNAEREYQFGKVSGKGKMKDQFDLIVANESEIKDLINENDAPDLFKVLEKMASETGNEIELKIDDSAAKAKSKKPKEEKEDKTIVSTLPSDNYLGMSIQLVGSYQSVYKFLKKLENVDYYNDVISTELVVVEEDDKDQAQASASPFAPNMPSNPETGKSDELKLKAVLGVVFYKE